MSGLPALEQHQTWPGGVSHRSKPAAAMNQSQDWPAMCRAGITGLTRVNHNTTSRGICPGTLNSHRLDSLPSRRRVSPLAILLPVNRGTRQSIRATGFPSDPAQSRTNQGLSKLTSGRVHIRRRLSCVSSSGGFKTIGKAFADGQNLFARGSKND